MNFKVKKIYKKTWKDRLRGLCFWKTKKEKQKSHKGKIFLIFCLGIFLWYGMDKILGIQTLKKTADIILNSPLERDKNGHTNFLLLGVAGNHHEGGNLSDSIIIASLDPSIPSISLLSLPRDLYIESSNKKGTGSKINEIYARARSRAIAPFVEEGVVSMNELSRETLKKASLKGLDFIKKEISHFSGIEIHYGTVINFDVFEDIIESLGGVDIFVQHDIVDHQYPDNNYGYQTFIIRRGLQHLDGPTALKYVRSRKTTSDYSRAQRQQDVLLAIKEKALKLKILTNPEKLKSLYNDYKQNIEMDIGIPQMIALANAGLNLSYKNTVSTVLSDDPTLKGGYLYPPDKSRYGGQFVLLPEDPVEVQNFMDLVLVHSEVLLEKAQLSILNGSAVSGSAQKLSERLKRLGFHVLEVGNFEAEDGKPLKKSFLRNLKPQNTTHSATYLESLLGAKIYTPLEKPKNNLEDEAKNSPKSLDNLIDLEVIMGLDILDPDPAEILENSSPS